MSLTDPIGDALTSIRNASRAHKERVDIKASNLLEEILKILRRERFIHDYRRIEDKKQGVIRVYLKKTGEPLRKISKILRVSRPGLRRYAKKDSIPTVLSGLGLCVLSTPIGILTGEEAKKRAMGGEVICEVW
jgi:small subunit ribosomal protein S8